jgi:TRAP-type C4-dicarboxylate transport system permease small subunit
LRKTEKIGDLIEKVIGKIVLVLMGTLVTLVFLQVILRYFFSSGMVWAEELERFIFVWLMFLGITLGVYKKKHIAVDLVVEMLEKRFRGFITLSYLLSITFFVILAWQGYYFCKMGFDGTASVLPIKLGFIYLVIPVSSILAVVFYAILMMRRKEAKND